MGEAKDNGHGVRYRAVAARARWRALYLKAELKKPMHKAAQRWLAATAAELFDVAEVRIKAGGVVSAKGFEAGRADEPVSLELSRDAVLGIKYAVIGALTGEDDGKPASLLERRDLLEACAGIGPDGVLRRQVEKEAKLPESEDLDEDAPLFEEEKKDAPANEKAEAKA